MSSRLPVAAETDDSCPLASRFAPNSSRKGTCMRRLFVSVAIVAFAAMGAAAVTAGSAGAEPVGGCPNGGGWLLGRVSSVVDSVDNGSVHDQNGDGFLCLHFNAGQTAKNGGFYSYTWKDNTNPIRG